MRTAFRGMGLGAIVEALSRSRSEFLSAVNSAAVVPRSDFD